MLLQRLGSESLVHLILKSNAFAHKPLIDDIDQIGQLPVLILFGDNDWTLKKSRLACGDTFEDQLMSKLNPSSKI